LREYHTAGGRPEQAQSGCPHCERLLAAAEVLFAECGYRRATVARICAGAGMATGSFYAHFGSKTEIFAVVVRRISAELTSAVRAAVEQADGQREISRACLGPYFELLLKRPWMDRIVRESESVAPSLFREHCDRLARSCARGVRRAQLAGHVDARYDPEVIAYIHAGIGSFIGMRWVGWTAGGRVPDDVLDTLLAVLAGGLPPTTSRLAGSVPEEQG
jgi:AcrR family transcriptional regulator